MSIWSLLVVIGMLKNANITNKVINIKLSVMFKVVNIQMFDLF